jgi:glycosyltransferase involved in cell wall biosynthesis
VVYVSHNSITTPLVRSQVLPYLDGLRAYGASFDLITFERDGLSPQSPPATIKWWPVRSQRGSGVLAKATDIARGSILAARLIRSHRATIVHARSYVPGVIALMTARVTGRRFVFDMRGFLPDEYVDARYWTTSDIRYRSLRAAERWLLRGADEIVVLTEAAARRLQTEARYARLIRDTPVTVIPCAADLDKFRPLTSRARVPTLIYTGSLGSFYELDPMLAVYRAARELVPDLRFVIVNRTEQALVRSMIARAGLDRSDIELRSADFAEMPGLVGAAHVGIALVRQSPSKVGSSAVKIAEYLACGLPVIVNAGLGDVDVQVRHHDAGHVMSAYGPADIAEAAHAVAVLAFDEAARSRARGLAEATYDVRDAIRRYADVYSRVAGTSTT